MQMKLALQGSVEKSFYQYIHSGHLLNTSKVGGYLDTKKVCAKGGDENDKGMEALPSLIYEDR